MTAASTPTRNEIISITLRSTDLEYIRSSLPITAPAAPGGHGQPAGEQRPGQHQDADERDEPAEGQRGQSPVGPARGIHRDRAPARRQDLHHGGERRGVTVGQPPGDEQHQPGGHRQQRDDQREHEGAEVPAAVGADRRAENRDRDRGRDHGERQVEQRRGGSGQRGRRARLGTERDQRSERDQAEHQGNVRGRGTQHGEGQFPRRDRQQLEIVHPQRGVVTGQQRAGHPAEQPAEAERRGHGGARTRVVIVRQASQQGPGGQQRHEQRKQQATDQAAAGPGHAAAQDRAAHLDQDANHDSPSAAPARALTMCTKASSRG
jgi:hypothetical protein